MRNHSFLDLRHEIYFSNCMHFWCTHRYQETPNPPSPDIAFGKHDLLEFRIRDNQQIEPARTPKRPSRYDEAPSYAARHCEKQRGVLKSEHHRDAFRQVLNSWFIMLDFAGITPSAILVKKWRGKPLFMALRRDLPGNPLSAQIYLEIE